MRIAIVHDWLVTNGGAEKVLRALIEIYPDADVFTLVDFLDDTQREKILQGKKTITSFIQKLPFAKKHFRNYLPFFPIAIERFDLSRYDLIISSSWAVAKGAKTSKSQLHISYCYTPIRYAWDMFDEYTQNLPQPKKFFVQATLRYIRKWDIRTLYRVDHFIADSKFVQKRIQNTYGKESVVIYPPVETNKFTLLEKKEEFYLTASRLVPYKKVDLIVKAFNKMKNKKLIVVGDGEELEKIQKIAAPNVSVLGYQKEATLIELMQKAKGFVYAAIEDFGIVPIEAMACGTPVIALNKGATAETVEDGVTGVHFERQTIEDVVKALKRFETIKFDNVAISKKAQFYSTDRFKQEFRCFVDMKLKMHRNSPRDIGDA